MASENQGGNKIANLPGVYQHPETGMEIITQSGSEGYIQADAAVQVGFKYVGSEKEETKSEKSGKK